MKQLDGARTSSSAPQKLEGAAPRGADPRVRIAFIVLALAGTVLLIHGLPLTGPGELGGEWRLAQGLLSGSGAANYAIGEVSVYPLPYELIFVPLGLLNGPAVAVVGRIATLILIWAGLRLWSRGRRWDLLPALLSLPAIETVVADHLMAAVGLFALSLAAWAHGRNRWLLAGVALGIGGMRFANALPLALILLLTGPWSWRRIGTMLVGGLAVLVPLTVAAFVLDPAWPREYQHNLAVWGMAGLFQVASVQGGAVGAAGLVIGIAVAGAFIARGRGLDGASIALSASVLASPLQGAYTAVFALPALVRLGARAGYANATLVVSGALWLALALAGLFDMLPVVSAAGLWLLVCAYPLLRRAEPGVNAGMRDTRVQARVEQPAR